MSPGVGRVRSLGAIATRVNAFASELPCRGKRTANDRALTDTVTVRANRAAVQFDELPGNGQAESQPAVAARKLRIGLAERLEDEWQEVCRDALAGIDDGHLDVGIADAAYGRRHTTSRAGELDGVREEIPEHLLESRRIGADHPRVWIDVYVQGDPLSIRRGPHALDRLSQYRVDGYGPGLQPDLSARNSRNV